MTRSKSFSISSESCHAPNDDTQRHANLRSGPCCTRDASTTHAYCLSSLFLTLHPRIHEVDHASDQQSGRHASLSTLSFQLDAWWFTLKLTSKLSCFTPSCFPTSCFTPNLNPYMLTPICVCSRTSQRY